MTKRLPAVALLLVLLAGCSSVSTSRNLYGQQLSQEGDTIAHVHASTWGVYLLMLPLFTGSTAVPGTTVFGADTVSAESAVTMVTARSADLGATKTENLQSNSSTFWIFPVFLIKSADASGNALR